MANMANSVDTHGDYSDGAALDERLSIATAEIAEAEIRRAGAYGSDISMLTGKLVVGEHVFVPGNVFAAIRDFALKKELGSVTLASFFMKGNWRQADIVEKEIWLNTVLLDAAGYRTRRIPRTSPEADVILKIVPEQTSQPGVVALQRVRTFAKGAIELTGKPDEATDPRTVVNVRKNAWFALDLVGLRRESAVAAGEVELIIVSSLLRECGLDFVALEAKYESGELDPQALRAFLKRDIAREGDDERIEHAVQRIVDSGMPPVLFFERLLKTPHMQRVWSPVTQAVLESGVEAQRPFLVPAANTYHLAGTKHQPRIGVD